MDQSLLEAEGPDGWSNRDRARQMSAWCDMLWSNNRGWAAISVGRSPRYINGKYKYRYFTDYFERWPNNRDLIIENSLVTSERHDVFAAPLLRRVKSRREATGIPGGYLWADVDDEDALEALPDRLRVVPRADVVQVSSGRKRHVYLSIEQPLSLTDLVRFNRRFTDLVQGDAKWADNSLLRPPGTYNHKSSALGGQLLRVEWIDSCR